MKQKWIFTGTLAAAMAFMPMGADASSSTDGNNVPEYSISTQTFSVEAASSQSMKGLPNDPGVKISTTEAMKIALAKVPGAGVENIHEFELEMEHGHWEYTGEIHYNNMEYEFAIDANSGEILKWETEPLHG